MNSDHALDFCKERPFSCLERPSSLQILAASKIALRLWLTRYHVQGGRERGSWVAAWPRTFCKSSAFSCKYMFYVPASITNLIDEYIFIVGKEIAMWEDNFRKAVLQTSERTVMDKRLVALFVKSFDGVVFKPNGEICFQSSARNVLKMNKSSSIEDIRTKYRIACKFCLEDEIKETWPSVSETPNNVLGHSTLMLYWKLNLNGGFVRQQAIVEQLADSVEERNWAAFEYFWKLLDEERQIHSAIEIIDKYDFDISRRALLMLDEYQVREVCKRTSDTIFENLISDDEFSSYAIQLWTCMKNFIADDGFSRILHLLWQKVFNPQDSELTRVPPFSALLRQVWSSAPESLKSSIFESELFAQLDCNYGNINNYDLTFVFELLKNASQQSRKEIWANNWHKLTIRANISDLKKLKQLCSAGEDEIDLSTEANLSKFDQLKNYFNTFVNNNMYSELCEYLNLIANDSNRLETLSREIILANLQHISGCDDEELAKLHSFIYFTSSNQQSANKFIEELISNPECLNWIYSKLDEYRFDDVLNLSIRFPTSEKNIREVKRGFLTYCFGNFAVGHITGFNADKFDEFSLWCCVGEEKMMADLKNSLNIDDIFETVLDNVLENLIASNTLNQLVLSKLDEFLVWYFVSLEVAKAYKSSIMLVYRDCELVQSALRRNTGAQAQLVYFVLNWGFGHD